MVTMTGTFAPIGVPSALAGRVRSPRSFTPSDIGMARSLMVVVCVYCAGRGCQVLTLAVLEAPSAGETARGAATRAPVVTAASSTRTSGRDDIEGSSRSCCWVQRPEVEPVTAGDAGHRVARRHMRHKNPRAAGDSAFVSQQSPPGHPGTALV